MKTVEAPPNVSSIESMRDFGYSLGTALADVIDNSIAHGAKNIRLLAETTGSEPRVGVVDDGHGMSSEKLLDAMHLGSSSPLETRREDDLGRFGLGLKTASFSQCRSLTVVSRQGKAAAAARWDLDFVAAERKWLLQVPEDISDVLWADEIQDAGTLVLWEKLDRISGREIGDIRSSEIVRHLDEAVQHLELVFHRFLTGEPGFRKISISLNGRALKPFDPFNSKSTKTIREPAEPEVIRVSEHDISFQAFTLPHHKSVGADEWERYAGAAGYLKNQGFYVYRARRLIIWGTWFGLARQTELTKLARVRIDIPNGLDSEWKIDVKKASAQPPYQVRVRLRQLIERIGATSKRVYTAKGKKLVSENLLPVWVREQNKNEISYRLNPDHPVLVEFYDRLAPDLRDDFLRIIEMAGATIPLDALFADISGNPEKVGGGGMSDEAVQHVAGTTFRELSRTNLSASEITEIMRATEPFLSNWTQTEKAIQAAALEMTSDG